MSDQAVEITQELERLNNELRTLRETRFNQPDPMKTYKSFIPYGFGQWFSGIAMLVAFVVMAVEGNVEAMIGFGFAFAFCAMTWFAGAIMRWEENFREATVEGTKITSNIVIKLTALATFYRDRNTKLRLENESLKGHGV